MNNLVEPFLIHNNKQTHYPARIYLWAADVVYWLHLTVAELNPCYNLVHKNQTPRYIPGIVWRTQIATSYVSMACILYRNGVTSQYLDLPHLV